jgi:hypothetical protein
LAAGLAHQCLTHTACRLATCLEAPWSFFRILSAGESEP